MKKEFKSLIDFLKYFRNEDICTQYLEKTRFRNGEFCPHCGTHGKIYRLQNHNYKCSSCHKVFTM
ncbi:transposase, partial [Myxococcota bacterium]|nr:transposase [Myxococcota bacterium]